MLKNYNIFHCMLCLSHSVFECSTSYQGPKTHERKLFIVILFLIYLFEDSICLLFHILYFSSPEAAGKLFLEVERGRSFEGVDMKC